MKNNKIFILTLIIGTLLIVGCSKNNENTSTEEKTQIVYCSECGEESSEVTKYCPNCGEEATWTTEKVNSTSEKDVEDEESSDIIENSNTTESGSKKTTINRREEYINILDQVEEGMSDLDELYAGSTVEMKDAAGQCLERWDNMLNEIYTLLKRELSTSEVNEMKNKQVEWIKYRDQRAENAASEFEGGTMEGLVYIDVLGQTTKERCYELVDIYME